MNALSVKRRELEEQEAQEYAALILDGQNHPWSSINQSIIDRLSLAALARIKFRAWGIVAEKRS